LIRFDDRISLLAKVISPIATLGAECGGSVADTKKHREKNAALSSLYLRISPRTSETVRPLVGGN
jgi:hypothetical protein